MADKKFTVEYGATGIAAYLIIRQESSSNVYDEDDGTFQAYGDAVDQFVQLTEDTNIKGVYEATIASANTFSDGKYLIVCYRQVGGSPVPASDTVIAQGLYSVYDNVIYEDEAGDIWAYGDRNLTPTVVDPSGLTAIDEDTGGTDVLRYVDSEGAGIPAAYILAYLKTDYDAGNLSNEYIQGAARTEFDGRWLAPIYLAGGYTYTLVFTKTGEFGPDTVEVTI
jgi:hypothetical protein